MKKIITILCMAVMPLFMNSAFAQDTIVGWTFPSTSADSIADVGITLNATRYISCQYGTWGMPSYYSIPTNYTTNGAGGAPDKCAQTTGWANGVDSVYWMVKFKTTGYGTMTLFSKQQGGGSNPGPRDFKVQYKLPGSTSPWIDLAGGTITCANNWTSGVVNGLSLPSTCDNQSGQVSIRWLITSNFDINGGTLLSTGITKIDDIFILGSPSSGISVPDVESLISVFPDPSNGNFCIKNNGEISKLSIYDIVGKCVYTNQNIIGSKTDFSNFEKGVYLIQITTKDNGIFTQKLVVE